MFLAAHLCEIVEEQKRHGIKHPNAQQVIYGYNDDVNSYTEGGERRYTSILHGSQKMAERLLHKGLRREMYPTDERILAASMHLRNVMAQLDMVNKICP